LYGDLGHGHRALANGNKSHVEIIDRINKALRKFEVKHDADPNHLVEVVKAFQFHMRKPMERNEKWQKRISDSPWALQKTYQSAIIISGFRPRRQHGPQKSR
jgi:hypothetical protein